jgi:alcohol dehydrogenase
VCDGVGDATEGGGLVTIRALVLEGPRRLGERRFPTPEVGDDDGILRVEACGLCGTDHEQYSGALAASDAFIPGHEIVGVVEAAGPRAEQRWGVRRGDRVAVEPFKSCRTCPACVRGDYLHCEAHRFPDAYGFAGIDRPPGLWGGYAEAVYLAADAMLLPVPAGLDPVTATLFNPLGAGIRWAVKVPGTGAGDIVAVLGPGIRGLCAAAAAKEAGAGFVLVTGAGRRDAARLALARRFGADLTVDVTADDPVRALRQAIGSLADVVVDVTANAPEAFSQALQLARPGGTVVVAGTRGPHLINGFSADTIVFKELRILGAFGVDSGSYRPALELLAGGRWPFDELPRRCVGFGGAAALLSAMAGESDEEPPVHGVIVPT